MAARKCAYFSEADVTVASRSFSPTIRALPVQLEELDLRTVPDDVLRKMLHKVFLVIAALSDPEENNRIGRLCAETGTLFNNADGNAGDVFLPAISRGENYTIAVSTSGGSPAVSRFLREHIEEEFPALDAMIELQQHLRGRLKETQPDQGKRSAILRAVLADPAAWEQLQEDPEKARNEIEARYIHG